MRADRLLAILLILQGRRKIKTQELAQELGVSRRTILRDLEALSVAGVPVYAQGGPGGGVSLDKRYRTNLTGLQDSEVRALFLAAQNTLLDEIGLGEAARSTLRKLAAALPLRQQPYVADVLQRILIDPYWWWSSGGSLPFWKFIQQGVFENRLLRVKYEHHDGEIVERELEPYALVAKSSEWYLVARRMGVFRVYRTTRLHEVSLLEDHFSRQADFDLAAFWQERVRQFMETAGGYRCTLMIHSDRMRLVERLVPGRYQVVKPEDAHGWVTVDISLESIDLARMLVFGLGNQVRVLTPATLRDSLRQAARSMLDTLNEPRI